MSLFADNYYQTVPDLSGGTVSPAGRDIPNLPFTENGKTAPGLKFPREGWRSENPDATAPLLGEPDLSVLLGTNKNNPDYNKKSCWVYEGNRSYCWYCWKGSCTRTCF
jgi:hypothetical protein